MTTLRPKPALPRYPEPAPGIDNLTTTMPGHPLAKLAYTLSEAHQAGHRLILGFPTREHAIAAHDWLFDQIHAATIPDPCEVLLLANRLGNINRSLYGGANTDYLEAIEMLVDCSDSIAVLGQQLGRQNDEIDRQARIIARAKAIAPVAFHVMEDRE